MKPEIVEKLHLINQVFYQSFADSFSATRQRIQPGIRRVLQEIPKLGIWLDIGCGNGNLAAEWIKENRQGLYCGVDFSRELLAKAEDLTRKYDQPADLTTRFIHTDLLGPDWVTTLPVVTWQGAMMFAVLHHLPGSRNREDLCKSVRGILPQGNPFYLSVWQIQNSQRMMKRVHPWSLVGIDEKELDPGDVLMDWRADASGNIEKPALRYVHIFSEDELVHLAAKTGFKVAESFFSDGKEGNLALYQKWL